MVVFSFDGPNEHEWQISAVHLQPFFCFFSFLNIFFFVRPPIPDLLYSPHLLSLPLYPLCLSSDFFSTFFLNEAAQSFNSRTKTMVWTMPIHNYILDNMKTSERVERAPSVIIHAKRNIFSSIVRIINWCSASKPLLNYIANSTQHTYTRYFLVPHAATRRFLGLRCETFIKNSKENENEREQLSDANPIEVARSKFRQKLCIYARPW